MSGYLKLYRYRFAYAKSGELKYTGHLDVHRIWERSLRRAHLHLAYSQGFHPQPRIQQACPLPLGFTSQCEVVDIWLEEPQPLEAVRSALIPCLPLGLFIQSIVEVDLAESPLQTQVDSAQYEIIFLDSVNAAEIQAAILSFLECESLLREKKGKPYDLRPLVKELVFQDNPAGLRMRLSAREGATGRPEEVLAALEIPPNLTRIERVELILNSNAQG